MKYIKTSLFMFCSLCTFGQDTLNHRFLVKTNVISYLPSLVYNTGKLNAEAEMPVGNRQSVAFTGAGIYSYGSTRPGGLVDFSVSQERTMGFLAGAEYRRYLNRSRVF